MKSYVRICRRFCLAVLAALIVLFVVCLFNAFRFGKEQVSVTVPPPAPVDEAAIARRLADALMIQSLTQAYNSPEKFKPGAFHEFHRFIEESFPSLHEDADIGREVVNQGSLLYRWEGKDAARQPILLMSHLDVAAAEEESRDKWSHGAFEGHIEDGFVWGRGALDIKCGVMGILEAVETLSKQKFQPQRTIYLAFGHDEESGGRWGNQEIAGRVKAQLPENSKLLYVLDEGGGLLDGVIPNVDASVAFVGVAEKGCVNIKLSVSPESWRAGGGAEPLGGHASMPPPHTAIGVLAAAIRRLEQTPAPARISGATELMFDYLAPHMSLSGRIAVSNRWLFGRLVTARLSQEPSGNAVLRTTMATTMIQGGAAENVLPTNASAIVNVRIIPGESPAQVEQRVKALVNRGVDARIVEGPQAWLPTPVSDTEGETFEKLQTTIREVFPQAIVAPGLLTGATDSRYYLGLAEDVYRFIPYRLKPNDMKRIHGIDERIAVQDYANIVRFFVRLIRNTAGDP